MPLTNGFISGPYTNIWVGNVVQVAALNSHELVPNQTTYTVYLLDWLD